MAKQVLNVGTTNNDKTGDTLRAGGIKIKSNFEEIYAALASDGVNISGGNLLKTGDYSDLINKPSFSNVAISGDFYDLSNRPDLGIFVGAPPNNAGVDGHVAGNMAFDGSNLYVCREDYIQQDQFTNFIFSHEHPDINFSLQARFSNATNDVALKIENPLAGQLPPQEDWTITDGTVVRTITSVSIELDVDNNPYYLCTLDGSFVSVADTYYEVSFQLPAGSYAFSAEWKPEYQDLVDAHVLGQDSKLYVTYDGYGRNVQHVIHDSFADEITISYQSGSNIADFNGIIVKLNQPEIWKSIPWAPTFDDPFPGGGAANTGDITFSGVKIIGDGTASGDGLGYSTIELVPDNDLYSISPGGDFGYGGQYLVIDPTSPNHIHIRAGGPQDEAAAQLILGGEKANVIVRDQDNSFTENHHVIINSQANDGTPYTWYFGSNGNITFPTLSTNLHNGGIQTAQTLKFGDGGQQVVITGPTPDVDTNAQRLIIQGQRGLGTGEGGDVYLWAGDAEGINAGDIKIYAGDADDPTSGYGGYVNIDGGFGVALGGHVQLTAGSSNTSGGNLSLTAGYGAITHGVVQVNTSTYQWTFGSDGTLTFPDTTVQETAWAGGRVVTVPTHSTGAIGDLEGDLSFNNGYIYYCTADYGQVGHQVSVATAYNGATALNTNSFQLTKSADTLQIAVGDIISDSDGGATSIVNSVSSDDNYTYVGTGSMAYQAVFPLTFTSTDYVSGGNIWKRVAWSNDTW